MTPTPLGRPLSPPFTDLNFPEGSVFKFYFMHCTGNAGWQAAVEDLWM